MESVRFPREDMNALTKVALDIFTDCSNVGVPFQEAMLAVYLSGLNHGSQLSGDHQ